MNFPKVLWSDISSIFRNRLIRISVIAIILIPLIYGGIYLAAFWDPYGKTDNLPVAVVNLDKGGISNDKKTNYGEDIVDNLKNNHDLNWKFVKTKSEAEQGLKGDKYYAIIIIPDDFSQRLIDVDKGKLIKPKLTFIANEKKNYIVGLISEKAAKALKDDVSKGIMNNFTDEVFDNLYDIRDGMESAADGTSQIKDGVTDLKDKVPSMEDGVGKLYDGSVTLNSKINDAADGSNKLRDGIDTLKGKLPDLVDGVNKLYNGSSSLNKKIGDAYDGSKQVRDGVIALNDKLPDLSDAANQLYDGSTSLKEGLQEVHDKMPDMLKGISGLSNGAASLAAGSTSLSSGVGQIEAAATTMQGSVLSKLKAGLPSQDDLTALSGAVQALNGVLPAKDLTTLSNTAADLQGLSSAIAAQNDNAMGTEAGNLVSIIDSGSLTTVSNDLSSVSQQLAQTISTLPDGDTKTQLATEKGQIDYVKGKIDTLNAGLQAAHDGLQVLQGSSLIKDGATQIKSNIDSSFTPGLYTLYGGLSQLYNKTQDLQNGTDDLYRGSQTLNDGLDKFKETVPELSNGVSNLSDGTRDLSDGLFKINEGSKTLTDKVGELNQKVPDIQQGVQDLYDGSTDLSDGLLKLGDGSLQLRDGVKTLKDKMPDLEDGVNKLYEGVAQLNDKLTEGAEKLSDKLVASSKAMGNFMSDPVNLQDHPLYEVKTYGEGLSPYFISLSLWVGALMMFFVITEKVNTDVKAGPIGIVLGKYLSYASVGILQAIIISIAVLKLGLKPSNIPIYFAFNIFLSFVFIAIIQNLIFLFGDAGRLLAVVFLVLQLTSSNGTFPAELLPKFNKTIGPYLPFTYSISAMREINSGIDYNVFTRDVIVLAAIMIVFLFLSVVLKEHSDKLKINLEEQNEQINLKEVETDDKTELTSV